MELPEETRASAAAMRRVVAEQIEALAELNAIVRAQPATHDLDDGEPPPPPPAPARPTTTRAEAQRPALEPREQAEVAEAPPPRRTEPKAEPKQQPVVAEAPAQPKATGGKSEEGGGWLRDVLRNATANQAAAQPQPLSSITDEIARALDPQALGEAWARYQAGEQNVFSRRIYTLPGQAIYDDVRKRLEADAEFRRAGTAYMAEFEQLLKRAAAGPDPITETRDYLTSERGKVYTMLAHASGRLR
jgi:hypothetical protein